MTLDLQLCLLGSAYLGWEVSTDHAASEMQPLFLQKKDLYVNRLISVIFSTEMCILQPEFTEKWGSYETEVKFL